MRVLVNLLWLRPGRVGGSENYLVRLLTGIATGTSAEDVDVHLAVQPSLPDAHPTLVGAAECHVAPSLVATGRPSRLAIESTWLPRLASALDVDVVHHAGGTVPPGAASPCVLTVHDLQYLAHPEFFSAAKRAYLRRSVPSSVRRATLTAAPSRHAASMVVDRFGVAAERVTVVPHGIDPPEPGRSEPSLPVDGPYLLYPAVTWPHKNHRVLLCALARMAPADRPALVLTGGAGGAERDLTAVAADLGVAASVRRLGQVPPAVLDALYRQARALVFPSRFEGFGAPVVEAWHRDCPVIASTAASLPEVVGDAGLLVDPDDVGGWVSAVARTGDTAERARLVAAGHRRAALFSVQAAAAAQTAAWRAAAAR